MKRITFRPLHNGKFRCLLDGENTDIMTRNCKAVRSRLFNQYNRPKTRVTESPVVVEPILLPVMVTWDHEWNCPNCNKTNLSAYLGQTKECLRCGQKVKIIGEKSRPQERSTNFSFFDW